MRKLREFFGIGILFPFLVWFFFRHIIHSDRLFSFRDLWFYFYPIREYTFSLIKEGVIPLWNPLIFAGNPLLAIHQGAVFYPLSVVYLLGDFSKAFNNFIYLHFILAGFFMYVFLRYQNLTARSAIFGAFSVAFSGYMFSTINLLASLASSVWVPLALWSFFKSQEDKRSAIKFRILAATLLAIMFFAGEPAIVYITCLMMLAIGFKRIKHLFFIFGIAALLSAVSLIPFIELVLLSIRKSITDSMAVTWSVPPHDFLNLIFPSLTDIESCFKDYWARQSWLLDYYIGLLPVMMAPVAIFFAKGRYRKMALFLFLFSVLLSLGKYTPFFGISCKVLPVFKLSRYPIKYFYFVTFSLSWLGAIGLDFYERSAKEDRKLHRFIYPVLWLALFAGFILLSLDTSFRTWVFFTHQKFFAHMKNLLSDQASASMPFVALSFFTIRRTLIFFLVFILLLFYGLKKEKRRSLVLYLLLIMVFFDVYSSRMEMNWPSDARKLTGISPNVGLLLKDKSLYRVMMGPAMREELSTMIQKGGRSKWGDIQELNKECLRPNLLMPYRVQDLLGYDSVERARMVDLLTFIMYGLKSPSDSRLLDMLNVKYISSPKILEVPGYKLVNSSGIVNIYENENVMPRAFLSEKAVILKGREGIFKKMADKDWDPAKEVILEEEPVLGEEGKDKGRDKGKEEAEIMTYSPNKVVIKTILNSPKFLVLSDSYYPGWKAYVDGRPAKIYIANYIVRALHLDSGRHIVRFIFDPFSFKLGALISLLSFFFALYIVIYLK